MRVLGGRREIWRDEILGVWVVVEAALLCLIAI